MNFEAPNEKTTFKAQMSAAKEGLNKQVFTYHFI
jgi:hypothetical protein